MTNLPALPLASFTASLWSSSKKEATVFLAVPTFSAMCATIFVLLSGLAAISFAYPPELSIHPERIEASRERKTPIYQGKTRAEKDYNEGTRGTQGENSINHWKNALFLRACAKAQLSCGNTQCPEANWRPAVLCYPCEPRLMKEKR